MNPPEQGFHRDHPAVVDGDLRLESEHELAAIDRRAQFAFQRHAIGELGRQSLGEMLGAAAPPRLRMIHGHVGRPHQRAQRRAMLRPRCDADRGADIDLLALQIERLGQGEQDRPADACRRGRFPDARQEQGELVARQPPDQRFASADDGEPIDNSAQATSDHRQQHIADRMAHRIVDGLEAIEIDEEKRGACVRAQADQRLVAGAAEIGAIGQPRYRVEQREPLNILKIGGKADEQRFHRRRQLRHIAPDLGRNRTIEIAVRGIRQSLDRRVDRARRR